MASRFFTRSNPASTACCLRRHRWVAMEHLLLFVTRDEEMVGGGAGKLRPRRSTTCTFWKPLVRHGTRMTEARAALSKHGLSYPDPQGCSPEGSA